jgi:hypothetical protein
MVDGPRISTGRLLDANDVVAEAIAFPLGGAYDQNHRKVGSLTPATAGTC